MRWAIAVLLLGMAISPPGGASGDVDPMGESEAACAPPCGYIDPILDIYIEDKPICGGATIIYAEAPPDDCYALAGRLVIEGVVRWYWEVSEEGTYPKDAGVDILITFSGAGSNPDWWTFEVTGENMVDGAFRITDETLSDPDRYRMDGEDLFYWFEEPITITYTRTGDPGDDDLPGIEARQGAVVSFIKSKSSESSARFRESFGVEEMRFMTCGDAAIAPRVDACGVPGAKATPAPAVLVGLVLAVLTMRRSSGR